MHQEKEYIVFCDESDKKGSFFSNFYGGVIVGGSKYRQVSERLESAKRECGITTEVKWAKVGPYEIDGYKKLAEAFFDEMLEGSIRMRVMFTQNRYIPRNLTPGHSREEYFILYYQFLKHAFGLQHAPVHESGARIRFYLDQLPDQSVERKKQFKGYMGGLSGSYQLRKVGLVIREEDVAEINSKEHILLQCADLVLGAMSFRLNDKHKAKIPGTNRRGKRTRAKEEVYNHIRKQIVRVTGKAHFNTGISTGLSEHPGGSWSDPYLHWNFVPRDHKIDKGKAKAKRKRPHST